jgi:flagellar protein FlaF
MHTAHHAYANVARSGLAGRALEAAVLSRCAADLQRAMALLPDGFGLLVEALERNRRCWELLAAQAREPDCPLPDDVRRNTLVMAAFIFSRTAELCEAPSASGMQALVDINRTLSEGLEGRAG